MGRHGHDTQKAPKIFQEELGSSPIPIFYMVNMFSQKIIKISGPKTSISQSDKLTQQPQYIIMIITDSIFNIIILTIFPWMHF